MSLASVSASRHLLGAACSETVDMALAFGVRLALCEPEPLGSIALLAYIFTAALVLIKPCPWLQYAVLLLFTAFMSVVVFTLGFATNGSMILFYMHLASFSHHLVHHLVEWYSVWSFTVDTSDFVIEEIVTSIYLLVLAVYARSLLPGFPFSFRIMAINYTLTHLKAQTEHRRNVPPEDLDGGV